MAVEFPPKPLGASLLHESCRETKGWKERGRRGRQGGRGEEEEREIESEREREDGVLSAKCRLNREERTMGGKIPLLFLFLLHHRH